jgi:hypothetical protein
MTASPGPGTGTVPALQETGMDPDIYSDVKFLVFFF